MTAKATRGICCSRQERSTATELNKHFTSRVLPPLQPWMPPEDHRRCQSLPIWNETAGEWGNSPLECMASRHCCYLPLRPQSTWKETNTGPVRTEPTIAHSPSLFLSWVKLPTQRWIIKVSACTGSATKTLSLWKAHRFTLTGPSSKHNISCKVSVVPEHEIWVV